MPNFDYENARYNEGYTAVCGCDEAGRGPLCGPVVAAAVILPRDVEIEGLNDSKKLTEKKRDLLFDEIKEKAIAYSIQFVYPEEIDSINIRQATHKAMADAVKNLGVSPEHVLIDGNDNIPFEIPYTYIVKGDAKSQTIAAASILAKVSRDRLMTKLDKEYPEYGFAKHKGYGTKEHMAALRKYGAEPSIYRTKFIRFLDKDENENG